MTNSGTIRAGVGGWTFEPWEGSFYPEKLPKAKQLQYAASRLATIEINGTYYGTQKPESFAKWAREAPDGFVFSVKGNRFCTNKKVLAEAGESIGRFLGSGLAELGDRLGPILWQFAPTKRFDADDFAAWLKLLPPALDGLPLRHALEVRHASFATPEFVALAASHDAAIVYAHHHDYPEMADVTAGFVYARLQKGEDMIPTAYPPEEIAAWAARARQWAAGGQPAGLPLSDRSRTPEKTPRDVFVYFIHEGKVRAPHAAMAFMAELAG